LRVGDRSGGANAKDASIRAPSTSMLAEPADYAFTRDGWLFELKLDGYRSIAGKSGGEAVSGHAQRQRLHRRLPRGRPRDQSDPL
jgi:hypothetical protein